MIRNSLEETKCYEVCITVSSNDSLNSRRGDVEVTICCGPSNKGQRGSKVDTWKRATSKIRCEKVSLFGISTDIVEKTQGTQEDLLVVRTLNMTLGDCVVVKLYYYKR